MNIFKLINGKTYGYWLVRHVAFWLVMYMDEFSSLFGITEPFENGWTVFIAMLLDIVMVYFNLYYLIPKFFQQGKVKNYTLLTLITLFLNLLIVQLALPNPCSECEEFSLSGLLSSFVYTIGLLGLAVSIKISKITQEKMQRLNELQKLQHDIQLNNLKKQVKPHFLFNTLNSIYVLTKENPIIAPDAILRLSDLMRYQTYDAAHKVVRLNQEIDFIEKYLALEKMRRDDLRTSIEINGTTNNIPVPPLLFLPFIENACKYSHTISGENEYVKIVFDHKNTDLFFEIENNIGEQKSFLQDDRYSGVGLENIQKRMELLFPNNHTLQIKETELSYKVKLIIKDIFKT